MGDRVCLLQWSDIETGSGDRIPFSRECPRDLANGARHLRRPNPEVKGGPGLRPFISTPRDESGGWVFSVDSNDDNPNIPVFSVEGITGGVLLPLDGGVDGGWTWKPTLLLKLFWCPQRRGDFLAESPQWGKLRVGFYVFVPFRLCVETFVKDRYPVV